MSFSRLSRLKNANIFHLLGALVLYWAQRYCNVYPLKWKLPPSLAGPRLRVGVGKQCIYTTADILCVHKGTLDTQYMYMWVCVLVAQSCLTLCNPMDYSPPGYSVLGILQAGILEWVAIPFSRRSSWPRDGIQGTTIWKTSVLQCSAFFMVQFSHMYMTTGKTMALTIWTLFYWVLSFMNTGIMHVLFIFISQKSVKMIHIEWW